jgi:hypothetical protein
MEPARGLNPGRGPTICFVVFSYGTQSIRIQLRVGQWSGIRMGSTERLTPPIMIALIQSRREAERLPSVRSEEMVMDCH